MDHTRNALIFGLAIVSYLMLLAWNEDYPTQTQSQSAQPVEQIIPQADLDLPSTSTVNQGASEDLPQVQDAGSEPAAAPLTQNLSLISVSTPVHEVLIDPRGGDIVRLALPQYPTSLETPDDPFVLLSNNSNLVYVSQSGLIGTNGPDASENGRPVYQSRQNNYSLETGELSVDLFYTDPNGVEITKRFTFTADDYLIDVQYLIDNQSDSAWRANLFGQVKRDASPDPSNLDGFGMRSFLGATLTTPDDPYKKVRI